MKIKTEHRNVILSCKSCRKKLNIEVKKCIHCGVKDPFFFNEIEKKVNIIDNIGGVLSLVMIGGSIYIGVKYSWWWLLLIVPVVLIAYVGIKMMRDWLLMHLIDSSSMEQYANALESQGNEIDIWGGYISKTLDID